MPDRRRHRGAHPADERLFAGDWLPVLRRAVDELSWLLSRGYAERSALKLVGDRYGLRERQRIAVMRGACSDEARGDRQQRRIALESAAGRPLRIDGYNVLTTVEAALAGGVLLLARDGCLRDMASMHGSYRTVEETRDAVRLIGRTIETIGSDPVTWYLDAPVSNSGRLRKLMAELAEHAGWRWGIEIVTSPDHVLIESHDPIASADSVVLDGGGPWLNLARHVVEAKVDEPRVVELMRSDGARRG